LNFPNGHATLSTSDAFTVQGPDFIASPFPAASDPCGGSLAGILGRRLLPNQKLGFRVLNLSEFSASLGARKLFDPQWATLMELLVLSVGMCVAFFLKNFPEIIGLAY
jgi:hypothetical protein